MTLRYAPRATESAAPHQGQSPRLQLRRVLQAMPAEDRAAALVPRRPLQYKGTSDTNVHAHALAADGVAGGGGALPHGDAIQASFGRHDVSRTPAATRRRPARPWAPKRTPPAGDAQLSHRMDLRRRRRLRPLAQGSEPRVHRRGDRVRRASTEVVFVDGCHSTRAVRVQSGSPAAVRERAERDSRVHREVSPPPLATRVL